MNEKKKAILITGASSGIGHKLVKKFVDNNFNVIGIARRELNLIELKNSLGDNNVYFDYYKIDITDFKLLENFVDIINEKYFVHCLINNAGITSFKKAIDDSFDDINKIIDTNLVAPIFLIKKFLPEMIKNQSGLICNILSVVNKKIFTNSSIYSATKKGLESFSNVLREEHRNDNIKVVNIFPGATITEIWPSKVLEKHSSRMISPEHIASQIISIYKLEPNISVEEIVIRPTTGDLWPQLT